MQIHTVYESTFFRLHEAGALGPIVLVVTDFPTRFILQAYDLQGQPVRVCAVRSGRQKQYSSDAVFKALRHASIPLEKVSLSRC